MKKRIIIYADGTWNSPVSKEQGKPVTTNVFKAFVKTIQDQCDDGCKQVVYYHEGVGTGNWLDKFVGGITGKGIDDNIKDIYRVIVENYELNDEIFLFGFSRGAYTVRSVAGMIRNCGILRRHNQHKIDKAYEIYRSRAEENHPNGSESIVFRSHYSYSIEATKIKFIGVWDTVGSLGIPLKLFFLNKNKYKFHDVKLSHLVEHAYHSISIDEKRAFFQPTLWQKQNEAKFNQQKLEQCWFRGVHSDVGGGYLKENLYLIPMHYLIKKAQLHGLKINYQVDSKTLEEAALGKINDSKASAIYYKFLPSYYRTINKETPKPENFEHYIGNFILNLFVKKAEKIDTQLDTCEFIHESVVYRHKKLNDPPVNLNPVYHKMLAENKIIHFD
jgi:uncharacterized protein (DUF2235 family)